MSPPYAAAVIIVSAVLTAAFLVWLIVKGVLL